MCAFSDGHHVRPFNRCRADCAVCAAGFAPGSSTRCHKCDGQNTGLVVGFATAAVLLMVFIAAVVVSYLVQVSEEGADEADNESRHFWRHKLSRVHRASLKAIPFSAVSIVVVVVQIVSQVRARMDDLNLALASGTQQEFGATLSDNNHRASFRVANAFVSTFRHADHPEVKCLAQRS